jgi:hypothetical protein
VKRHQKADENDWREASSESHLAERTVRKELELHADYENPRINSWDKDQKLLRDSNQELWNSFQKNHTPKEGEALGEKRVHKMSSRKRQRTIAKIRKSQETGHSIIRLKLPKIDLNPSLFKSIPR